MTGLAINSFGDSGRARLSWPFRNEAAVAELSQAPRLRRSRMPSKACARASGITGAATPASTRYSPLDQINASNVGKLEVAWRWKSLPDGASPDGTLKATPLMVDGVLYTRTGVHQAAAIDPDTVRRCGCSRPSPRTITGRGGVPLSGRGLAYWTDGNEKRLFRNTLDGRLHFHRREDRPG